MAGSGQAAPEMVAKYDIIRQNLDRIGKMLIGEVPDVVALQEADGPSAWSGSFDHVEYLAGVGDLSQTFRGEHFKAFRLDYGTALLSRLPLSDCVSHTFSASPPTPSKGFVAGRVPWPGRHDVDVTVVSVHLDFTRAAVRANQIREMVDVLSHAEGPLIVMGDFNCEWEGRESSLRTLAEELELRAYQPASDTRATFPGSNQRIDWILISSELEFVTHVHLEDALSDHRAVVAVVRRAPGN